jgi:pyroglutamyl-peptidase
MVTYNAACEYERNMGQRLILTGFGPFLTVSENPSERLAKQSGEPFEILDVSYKAAKQFVESIDPSTFDILVLLGVHIFARRQRVEFFARNAIGDETDSTGGAPIGPIYPDGPAVLRSTLWPSLDLTNCQSESFPTISINAGDYLCNYIYYEALRKYPTKKVGFLHIPPFEVLDEDTQHQRLAGILHEVKLGHRG